MAVQGWHVDGPTDRMGTDEEDSWSFVMREADRAETSAKEALQREWEAGLQRQRDEKHDAEQARLDDAHRRMLEEEEAARAAAAAEAEAAVQRRREGEELSAALLAIEKRRREEEVAAMLAEHRSAQLTEGEHRSAQWYAHRDSQMRIDEIGRRPAQAPVAEDRAALGFGTDAAPGEGLAAQGLSVAHLWPGDQLLGRPGGVQPGDAMGEAALPPSRLASREERLHALMPHMDGKLYAARTADDWGRGVGVRYAGATPTTEAPPPATEAAAAAAESPVGQAQWEEDLRRRIAERRGGAPATTDQLLRQHYNRVLAPEQNKQLPSAEEVTRARTVTHFHDNVWERRTGSSALERLLRSRQAPPSSLPAGSQLRELAEAKGSFPALEEAAARCPPVLVVKCPALMDVNGRYTRRDDAVFTYWEKDNHRICLSHGAWVIGHSVEDHLESGGAPVRSQGDPGMMPHEVTAWEWKDTPTAAYKPADADSPVTVEIPTDDAGDGAADGAAEAEAGDEAAAAAEEAEDPVAAALASGEWLLRTEPKSGRPYYFHKASRRTVWDLAGELRNGAGGGGPEVPLSPAPATGEDEGAAAVGSPAGEVAEAQLAAAAAAVPAVAAVPGVGPRAHAALESGAWREKYDPKTKRNYYIDNRTKKTCWNLEKELAKQGVPLPV